VKEAVIFDMDGVIVDSEPRHERAFLQVIDEIGYTGRHGITFSDYIGRSDKELWVDFVSRHAPPQGLEKLLEMKRERVVEIIRREQPLFDGLTTLVSKLAGKYHLGLASGSERAIVDEVLKLEGLGAFFGATVSGSEIRRGKPDPGIFFTAARLLGVAPAACWVVEDSKPGVRAGLAAGMRVIAITNTHPAEQLKEAHHVVRRFEDIERLL
jgi:HAD superfamily hydrolase (TIGR01509 family)